MSPWVHNDEQGMHYERTKKRRKDVNPDGSRTIVIEPNPPKEPEPFVAHDHDHDPAPGLEQAITHGAYVAGLETAAPPRHRVAGDGLGRLRKGERYTK